MGAMHTKVKIGFIGQGWIGKNYADHYEDRGFVVVRYSLDQEYIGNKDRIAECDYVFIAVPTPTTTKGFDDSIVRDAVSVVGDGKVAIIKSTIPPGTTRKLCAQYPNKFIVHSPEFLRESSVRYDVDHPDRVIVGIPEDTKEYKKIAEEIIRLHPKAGYVKIAPVEEAEFLKYTHNTLGYATIVFANILYDLSQVYGIEWQTVKDFILNNPWFPEKYIDPVHKSGRGAGGNCFIKDFAAFHEMYARELKGDTVGIELLEAFVRKNKDLLCASGKDINILRGVYGDEENAGV